MLTKIKQFVNPVRNFLLSKISNGARAHRADIILVIGVVLISLLSFAMGYIVASHQAKESIKLEGATEVGHYYSWNLRK